MKQISFYTFAIFLLIQAPNAASFNEDVGRIIDNCPLIDGKNLKGISCTYPPLISEHCLDNTTELAWSTECLLRTMLHNPIKETGWMSNTLYTATEFKNAYSALIYFSSQLNSSTLRFFWHVLEDGNVYGENIEGLFPQPKRAALFKELYEWSAGSHPDAPPALEAIRLERERLDAIAAEEVARAEAAEKTQDATSTLRHRKGQGTTAALGSDTEDSRAGEKDPLVPRPIRAH
jgi:hypothetical protein